MTYTIEPIVPREATIADLEGIYRGYIDRYQDFYPNDPPAPFEYYRARWSVPEVSHRTDSWWVAREGGDVVGSLHLATWEDHADSGLLVPVVPRDQRGRGLSWRLVGAGLDGLEAQGRTKLIIDAPTGTPFEASLERLGLSKALTEQLNRVYVSDIDWDLMDQWVEALATKAPDYELRLLESPLPDESLEQWCLVLDSMNDAPLEGLELEDTTMSPEKWRSIEGSLEDQGLLPRIVVAVHKPTGEFGGLTTAMAQVNHPIEALQDDTGVAAKHRGKGLGRALKAANAKRLLAEFPDIQWIETGNAGSNEHMLAINVEMGFKTALEMTAWQGTIADARTGLGL